MGLYKVQVCQTRTSILRLKYGLPNLRLMMQKKLIKQGVSILLCHGYITNGAKKLLNEAGIQYRENICSDELKIDQPYHDE